MGQGRGNFFAVDRRTWERLCALGMNAAVAYLVLACFSGRDNRTTAASVQAIEKYTAIARSRAKLAISALLSAGLVRQTQAGMKPLYDLLPFAEIVQQETAADLIWLPNSLVTGAAGETPPVEMVRQTADVMTLRLLIDFYHAQNLRDDGGISRRLIWTKYERHRVGEFAEFVIWGFPVSGTPWVTWVKDGPTGCHCREGLTKKEQKEAGVDFFRRLSQLQDLRLLEWVPHLFESTVDDAEIIHPYGMGQTESIADRLGCAAHEAGQALLMESRRGWAEAQELRLVPVPLHLANVAMIGVARLHYRPRTALTAAWWADLNEKGERYIHQYVDLGTRAETSRLAASR